MQVFRNLGEISQRLGPTVVSIGNFDGVHLGHRFILDQLRQSAAARSLAVRSGYLRSSPVALSAS